MAHWQYQGRAQPVSFSPPVVVPFVEPTIIFDKAIIYQSYAVAPFVPPTFDTFWYTPFSEPVRVKPRAPWFDFDAQGNLEPIVSFSWYNELARVPPKKPRAAHFPYESVGDTDPVVSFSWFNNLSTPPGSKPRVKDFPFEAWRNINPEVSFGWYGNLSEFPGQKKFPASQQMPLAWSTFTPAAFSEYWYSPFSEPQRNKLRTPWFDFDAQGNVDPIVSFSWFNNLSEHPGQKRALHVSKHPELAWVFAEYDDLRRAWYSPFSEPKRDKPRAQNQQELAWSTFTPAAAAFTEFWYSPFSEPKRERRAQQQQTLAWVFAEYDDLRRSWYSPLTEPVRLRRFDTAQQSFIAYETRPVVSFGWYNEFARVTPPKPRTTHFPWEAVGDTDPIVSFSWYNWLNDPVRVPRRLAPALNPQEFVTDLDPVVSFSWYGWLHDPVRFRRFPAAEQQAFAIDTSVQVDPRDIKWYFPWTDPVRVKLRLYEANQPTTVGSPFPFVSFGWFGNLSEPVRFKVSLRVSANPFTVADTRPVVSFGWFGNLSEPKRERIWLKAEQQRATFFDPFPIVNRGVMGWFNWISEPVRLKIGLRAHLQKAWTGPDRTLAQAIILTMAATEDNEDQAQFAISIYNRASHAVVSIEEIKFRDDAAISIREP